MVTKKLNEISDEVARAKEEAIRQEDFDGLDELIEDIREIEWEP